MLFQLNEIFQGYRATKRRPYKTMNDILLWQIRHFVYTHFADTTHAPRVDNTAAHFNITTTEASEYYKELHNRHAFFLDLETLTIRMANPCFRLQSFCGYDSPAECGRHCPAL